MWYSGFTNSWSGAVTQSHRGKFSVGVPSSRSRGAQYTPRIITCDTGPFRLKLLIWAAHSETPRDCVLSPTIIRIRAAISFLALPTIRSARWSAVSAASTCRLKSLRCSLASLRSARSTNRSSSLGIGGRSSMGMPAGLMMCFTTWRFPFDTRHPGLIATTSPARRELLGSWTR